MSWKALLSLLRHENKQTVPGTNQTRVQFNEFIQKNAMHSFINNLAKSSVAWSRSSVIAMDKRIMCMSYTHNQWAEFSRKSNLDDNANSNVHQSLLSYVACISTKSKWKPSTIRYTQCSESDRKTPDQVMRQALKLSILCACRVSHFASDVTASRSSAHAMLLVFS